MKLMCLLLSFYIFALAATPCVDIESESAAHKTVSCTTEKDNHSHDKNNDMCSPFCICNCCGQLTLTYVPTIIFDFQAPFTEIRTSNPIYASVFHSNFYGSIWQPPQLV
ncbi:MAG: hypothetical protein QM710_14975 [Flavobacterium sp.]